MLYRSSVVFTGIIWLLSFSLMSCQQQEEKSREPAKKAGRKATAQMNATNGNTAHGTVTFTEVDGGIEVVAEFEGVPEGEHGFHIHEVGDCSSGDGKSAGGHFNPDGYHHAGRDAEKRHVGDLGNVTADANGIVKAHFTDRILSFEGDHSIIGRGVILHAAPDDLTSQPTGAAGARISCGVIKAAE